MPNETTTEVPSNSLSPTVKALGVVSLCTDFSSEMVYPITPLLLTQVLGAPPWTIGLIEGIAESTASLLKLASGWISDRSGRRKPLTLAGYGLAAVAKPLIALATAWPHVLIARFLDRTGKGLRTAPRDALIAENCSPAQRGRAFGFHRSMDTIGAVIGPLVGWLFLHHYPGQYRSLYLLAFVPALLGVIVLATVVKEQRKTDDRQQPAGGPSQKLSITGLFSNLSADYKRYLFVVAVFGLGNSSDAFLLLRARDMGVSGNQILLIYALFNTVEASFGYLAGRLSDRVGRRPLVVTGWLVFALVYSGFAGLHSATVVWMLFVFYGLYYTLTQGVQRALAADLVHPERRGTELGAFHMLVGLSALPASLIAGWLYNSVSHSAPFIMGACAATVSALLMSFFAPRQALDKQMSSR